MDGRRNESNVFSQTGANVAKANHLMTHSSQKQQHHTQVLCWGSSQALLSEADPSQCVSVWSKKIRLIDRVKAKVSAASCPANCSLSLAPPL